MKNKIAVILLFIYFLAACKDAEAPHLPREKMISVLTDINIAEVYSTMVSDSTHMATNKNMDSLAAYYNAIFDHHGITREQFERSVKWYSDNPAELDSVYVNILTELSTLEGVENAGSQ